MIGLSPKFDARFKRRFVQRFEQFEFQAGLFPEDEKTAHFPAASILTKTGKKKKKKSAYTRVDGMKARRKQSARQVAGSSSGPRRLPTMKQILAYMSAQVGVDLVKKPFLSPNSATMRKMRKALYKMFTAKNPSMMRKQVEAALVNVIREPIKNRRYGNHSKRWARVKGFQRRVFDTGQLYKSFKARVFRVKPKVP